MAPAAQEQWYILYAVPDVEKDRSKYRKFPNVELTFNNKVPLPSHLYVASNIGSAAETINYPYIAAADSGGCLLLCGYTTFGVTFYITDPCFRRTLGIFPPDGGFNCRHCVGLIRKGVDKPVMVAELNPCFFNERVCCTILCTEDLYSWVKKEPDCSRILEKQRWRGDGVLTHGGLLWWFDFTFCILACNPFDDTPVMHQIKFPHVLHPLPFRPTTTNGDVHRCLKVSEGSLRYVQIHAHALGASGDELVVSMWTLSSNDPSEATWELTHQVLLAEIWNHETYKRAPLRPEVIPTLALVSPIKAHEIYFFLDEHIFSVDLLSKSVVQFEEFKGLGMPALSSRLVHAWQFPPELAEYQPVPGTDESNATWVYVLNRYDSVQDFHGQLFDARDR